MRDGVSPPNQTPWVYFPRYFGKSGRLFNFASGCQAYERLLFFLASSPSAFD